MEPNDRMKRTIKNAWAKGFSQFLALAGAILLVFVLFKFDVIMGHIKYICNVLMPIIMGVVIAYLINPMVGFYERKLDNTLGRFVENKSKKHKKPSMRGLSVLISFVIVIAVYALIWVIPVTNPFFSSWLIIRAIETFPSIHRRRDDDYYDYDD